MVPIVQKHPEWRTATGFALTHLAIIRTRQDDRKMCEVELPS